MPILVVCPGCRKSFNVSETFAGRTGACPKCKHPIKVPAKSEEVKVHTPEAFDRGGRTKAGKLALKPIARQDVRFNAVQAAIVLGGVLAVAALTFFGGRAGLLANPAIVIAGLTLVSWPLVLAGYTFLRDDELEPYRGRTLWIRTAICAAAYVLIWGILWYVLRVFTPTEIWMWLVIAPPVLLLGGLAAFASLDLEYGNALLHYGFFLLVTVGLRWLGGMGWIWEVVRTTRR